MSTSGISPVSLAIDREQLHEHHLAYHKMRPLGVVCSCLGGIFR